jgi:hypothetical protein
VKVNGSKTNYRWFNIASLISIILAACTIALWTNAFAVDPSVSLSQNFHIRVTGRNNNVGGSLDFFNNAEVGPFGGVSFIVNSNTPPSVGWGLELGDYGFGRTTDFERPGKVSRIIRFCDLPGIHFEHIRSPDEALPLWVFDGKPLVSAFSIQHFACGVDFSPLAFAAQNNWQLKNQTPICF